MESRRGLLVKPVSSTLAIYMTGLTVMRQRGFSRFISSASRPNVRTAFPSSKPFCTLVNKAQSAIASLSPDFAFLVSRCTVLSTVSMSASASSVFIVSTSESGSTLLATCTTFASLKQRTTCAIASVSRMLAKNLLPKPSPLDAPATRPAMSTNSTIAGWIFCGLTISISGFMRGSGTSTMPTLGSIVQKG